MKNVLLSWSPLNASLPMVLAGVCEPCSASNVKGNADCRVGAFGRIRWKGFLAGKLV